MNIIQQPDALSFSMNLKKFIVSATGTISFILRLGERELISHKYEPGTDGMVEIDVRDIVHPQLSYIIKDSGEVYRQSNLTADFTAIINTTEIVFRVVRGGVDQLADSAANFLTQNFLTWQPSVKPVTYYSPEFLTYYTVGAGKIKLRAYFTDDEGNVTTEQEHAIVDIIPGIAYTIPLQYSVVTGWLGNKLPAYYDVWAESTAGHRFTYIQRYYAENMRSAQEQWVLFENSLGGLDTFRAYGSDQFKADHTHNLAETDEVSQEYRVDTERKHQKNTGYLNKEEARWLLDFFPSQKKYLYTGSYLRQIVVMESDVTGKLQKAPLSYTFTYKYADARPLLNLPRTDVPAAVLNITIPEVGSFTVPPRLAEVSRLPLSEGTLFPVQNPYSENWGTTTVGMIGNFISKIFASYKFFKGYFSIPQFLILKYPNPQEGWYAFVGTPWPGKVYECRTAGTWVDTGVSPTVGDDIFVELLKRYIDGTTIYWDAANRVIKARGGGDNVFSIVVSIETVDIGRVSVTASGDSVGVTPSADGGTYTVTGTAGGTVTVRIVAEEGYQVQKLDVDDVSQGNISEYTFERLDRDHTMKVWMEVSEETPTEFLIRSDLPGMYYSGTQAALDAVKASYPDGLTRDVTISCVKPAKERRGGAAWVARLADWNLRSAYMLTLDGAGMLTYDCRSAGGLSFANVSNVRCHDISFVDVANGVDFPSPDELSAVLFRGEAGLYARNLYVDNCRITGATTLSGTDRNSYYSVISKYAENVYLVDNRIDQCHCIPVKTVECSLLVLVRNYIRADYSYGIIGHPALCTVSGCEALIAEDNELTGSTGEYYFYCRNVERVYMRRNRIHGGRGRIAEFASRNGMREVSFESNLVYDMLKAPSAAWVKELFALCRISAFHMNNNTFVMSGEWYEQYVTRGGEIAAADIFNNIVIGDNGDEGRYVGGFYFNMITTLNIGSNLYRMPVKAGESGTAHRSFIVVSNTDNDPGSVTLTGPVTSSIRQLNALGYETGSDLAAPDVRLLDETHHPDTGFAYYSNETYTPATDADYKAKAETGNSRGCFNLSGTPIDETDEAAGFSGVDYSENKTFSSRLQYFVLADSLLLVAHNTPDRGRFIRFSAAGTQHSELVLGRYGLLRLLPVLDNNGEYSEDELYTVNIE